MWGWSGVPGWQVLERGGGYGPSYACYENDGVPKLFDAAQARRPTRIRKRPLGWFAPFDNLVTQGHAKATGYQRRAPQAVFHDQTECYDSCGGTDRGRHPWRPWTGTKTLLS